MKLEEAEAIREVISEWSKKCTALEQQLASQAVEIERLRKEGTNTQDTTSQPDWLKELSDLHSNWNNRLWEKGRESWNFSVNVGPEDVDMLHRLLVEIERLRGENAELTFARESLRLRIESIPILCEEAAKKAFEMLAEPLSDNDTYVNFQLDRWKKREGGK